MRVIWLSKVSLSLDGESTIDTESKTLIQAVKRLAKSKNVKKMHCKSSNYREAYSAQWIDLIDGYKYRVHGKGCHYYDNLGEV